MKYVLLAMCLASTAFARITDERAEAQQTLDKWAAAFNAGNADQLADGFAKDGTLITPDGRTAHGRDEIRKLMKPMFDGPWKGTTSRFVVTGLRTVGPNSVFVDATHQVVGGNLPPGMPRQYHVVVLLQNEANTWQATEVRPYAFQPRASAQARTPPAPPR
jgi:uncharacterized protein (TIGR02246 family)